MDFEEWHEIVEEQSNQIHSARINEARLGLKLLSVE